MARSLKVYNDSNAMIPPQWLETTGAPSHHVQGDLTVIAATKAAAADLLSGRGVDWDIATRLVREMRCHPVPPTDIELAAKAGVLDLNAEGVYLWHRAVKGNAIFKVSEAGAPKVVGYFEYDKRSGLSVRSTSASSTVRDDVAGVIGHIRRSLANPTSDRRLALEETLRLLADLDARLAREEDR